MEHLRNKITLGDSLELMKQIPDNSIDLIVTDPPYLLDTTDAGGSTLLDKRASKLRKSIAFIADGFCVDSHLKEWERISKQFHAFIFCSNKQISDLMKWGEARGYSTHCLVWYKTNATPFCSGTWQPSLEFCIHIREKGSTFQGGVKLKNKCFVSPIEKSKWGHPTEKPSKLIEKYIKVGSNEGDLILDPFAGSGTTGNACVNLKRDFISFEIEPKYQKIAQDRIDQSFGEVGLFA